MNVTFKKTTYLFVIPAAILYITFLIIPVIMSFGYSFTNSSGFGNNFGFVGYDNYVYLIKDGTLLNALKNTLIYTIVTIIFTNILSLALALVLNMNLKLKGVYRTISYLPALFSSIVIGFIWGYVYLPDYGMISSIMHAIGLKNVELNLIGNFSTAIYAVAVVDIWRGFGGSMIIYLAGLQSVPKDLLEAGDIDGCNGWHSIRYIKIPLLAPAITINITLGFISGIKQFDYIFTMTQGGPGKASRTLMYEMFKMAFSENLFGKASALGVISFVVILLVTTVLVKALRNREVYQ